MTSCVCPRPTARSARIESSASRRRRTPRRSEAGCSRRRGTRTAPASWCCPSRRCAPTHSCTHSLVHALTRSLTHSLAHSLTQFHFTHDYAIHNVFNGVETANYTAIDIDYEADARVVAALTDAASGAASSHVYVFDFEQRYVPTHSLTHPPTRSLTHALARLQI